MPKQIKLIITNVECPYWDRRQYHTRAYLRARAEASVRGVDIEKVLVVPIPEFEYRYFCSKADRELPNEGAPEEIPDWCPLWSGEEESKKGGLK